jgi:opacity protein-like surface antigen
LCSTNQTGECYNAFPGTLPFPAVPGDPAANAAFGVFLSDVRLPLQGANRPVVLNGPGPFSALGGRGRHDATFLGGAQIGGQAQFGSIVIGVEADFNWLGSRGRGSGSSDSQFAFAGENDGAFTATRTGPLLRTYPGGLAALPAEAATTVNFIDLGPNYGVRYNGQVAMAERDQDRWLSTLRGRLGFAVWDRFMIYGTGGVALQSGGSLTAVTTLTRTDSAPAEIVTNPALVGGGATAAGVNARARAVAGGAPYFIGNGAQFASMTNEYVGGTTRRSEVGWAAGVGFEWAVTNNVSVGLEYVHADFGSYRVQVVDPIATAAGDARRFAFPLAATAPAASAVLQQLAATTEPIACCGSGLPRAFAIQNRGIAGPAPAPVVRSISFKDAVDTVRVKLNVRFNTESVFAPRL